MSVALRRSCTAGRVPLLPPNCRCDAVGAQTMAKNILLFADDTGNEGGLLPDESRTNVYKVSPYWATRNGPDTSIDPRTQIAFYLHGIGTPTPGRSPATSDRRGNRCSVAAWRAASSMAMPPLSAPGSSGTASICSASAAALTPRGASPMCWSSSAFQRMPCASRRSVFTKLSPWHCRGDCHVGP